MEPVRRRRTPEDPRDPRERGFAGAGQSLFVAFRTCPSTFMGGSDSDLPKRCWNRSGTPRTATDQRRRNRAPGDPGDPRGSGGAAQAPKVQEEP
eukprot:gene14933-biopygen12679